jgi:hypothetical protein
MESCRGGNNAHELGRLGASKARLLPVAATGYHVPGIGEVKEIYVKGPVELLELLSVR